MRRTFASLHGAVAVGFAVFVAWLAAAPLAHAIPVFARRYNQSCTVCHAPFPRLTTTGESVAGNGFRMAPGEDPPDALGSGDPLLSLPKTVPLAIRVDGRFQASHTSDETTTDFQSPWVMKILSSAALSGKLSYYFYFLMTEGGSVVGPEDAFLYWNDVAGRPVDFAIGQFQVSDPLFKRELRLPVDDFMVYRAKVGEQPADLTYDRGLMMIAEPVGLRLTLEVLNGNGLPGESDGRFDDDPGKNVFGHLTRDLLPALRLGAMGYFGRQSAPGGDRNTLWMAGADATCTLGAAELNLQYVHREDTRPTFTPGERLDVMDGGFAELLVIPEASRWYGYALYNRVEDTRALLDMGEGTANPLRLYETASVGVGRRVRTNLRIYGEALYDTQREATRVTLGMTTVY